MMQKPLLTEFWRDVVSLSSAVLTVLGLVYAIRQIWKTQSAADAALKAANQAVTESRKSFERYTLANVLRYLAESKLYIKELLWDKASLRLSDLAEQAAQLDTVDPEWKSLTIELRQWSDSLAKLSAARNAMKSPRFAQQKWTGFAIRLQAKIDEQHGPFRVMSRGQES